MQRHRDNQVGTHQVVYRRGLTHKGREGLAACGLALVFKGVNKRGAELVIAHDGPGLAEERRLPQAGAAQMTAGGGVGKLFAAAGAERRPN